MATKKEIKNLLRREWWRGFITAQDKYRIIRPTTDIKELEREYRKYKRLNPNYFRDLWKN